MEHISENELVKLVKTETSPVHQLEPTIDFSSLKQGTDTHSKYLPAVAAFVNRERDSAGSSPNFLPVNYEAGTIDKSAAIVGDDFFSSTFDQTANESATYYGLQSSKRIRADIADVAGAAGGYSSYKYNVKDWGKADENRLAALPFAALAGTALYADSKNLFQSKSLTEKGYYAAASATDLGALAGSAMMLVPRSRSAGDMLRSLSFSARTALAAGDQLTNDSH